MLWVGYNELVPKRHCTTRAQWRLQPGKPAEPLPAHYRLDCDYGTAVIACWEDGGSEPVYVCESHANQLAPPRKSSSDVRIITAQLEPSANPVKSDDPIQIQEVATPIPKAAASTEAARSLPDTNVARAISDPPAKSPVRDLSYGNPAKAMVDEAIWNLATGNYQVYKTALQQGKSAFEAAQAAGGQLAIVHRKISDYALNLEAVLSESKAVISLEQAIDKPLEVAVLEIIGNSAMTDSEKDAAIQQLGALQERAKQGLQGDITPVQANRIILAIGDRLNWGGPSDVPDQCKPVYRTLYASLKTAIRTTVPEAQDLHDRLTNLYAAKSDLEIC